MDNIKQYENNRDCNSTANSFTRNGKSSECEGMALSQKKKRHHEHNDTTKSKEDMNETFNNQTQNGIIRNYQPY